MQSPGSHELKFVPYGVDLRAGELRKNSTRIRLQEKPLRVFALLAERRGELVTREELKKHPWPEETFVDFETGLNTAVKKLRGALSEHEFTSGVPTPEDTKVRLIFYIVASDKNPLNKPSEVVVEKFEYRP
jgi:DNA-binding winged helix-turn-helix (wHTH) protein